MARRGRAGRWIGLTAALGLVLLSIRQVTELQLREVRLYPPVALLSGLRLRHPPTSLLVSPNGRYLGIVGYAAPAFSGELTVVDRESRTVLGRIAAPHCDLERAVWSSDNRLWLRAPQGWRIYRPPFRVPALVPGEHPWEIPLDAATGGLEYLAPQWVFEPDRRLLMGLRPTDAKNPEANHTAWTWHGWDLDGPRWKVAFVPRHRRSRRLAGAFVLSPDRARVALAADSQASLESQTPEELWTADLETGQLRFLHAGRRGGEWVDAPVQDVTPAWVPDSRSIVFGDRRFGIETIEVETGVLQRLLPEGWGERPQAGRHWVAFHRGEGSFPDLGVVSRVSRGGRRWGTMRWDLSSWRTHVYTWDPEGRALAIVGSEDGGKTYRVLQWLPSGD